MDKKLMLSRSSYVIISVGFSLAFVYSALPYYCMTSIVIPGWNIYWNYAETQKNMMLLFPTSTFLLAITTLHKKRTLLDVFLNIIFPLTILMVLRIFQYQATYTFIVLIVALTSAALKVVDFIYSERYLRLNMLTRLRCIYFICRKRVIIVSFFLLAPMIIYTNIQQSSSSGRVLYQAVTIEQEPESSEFPDLVSEEQWRKLSLESRLDLLEKYICYECEALGIQPVNVYMVQEDVDGALAYYSHNDNGIFFSIFFLEDASLEDALYVSSHEAYHKYENALIDILFLLDSAGASYQRLDYFNEALALRQASIDYEQDAQSYDTYALNLLEIRAEEWAKTRNQELKDMGYLE